jgi:hypothetical protein
MLCILYAQQPWFLLFFCSTSDLVVVRVQVVVEEEKIHKYSTLMYRAPEMVDLYLNCEVHVPFRVQLIARVLSFASSAFCRFVRQVAEKVDCWAMGCILFALCFRDHPLGINVAGSFHLLPDGINQGGHYQPPSADPQRFLHGARGPRALAKDGEFDYPWNTR